MLKKILIIDDDEVFAKIIADSLPKDKYTVEHVGDGEEGLVAMTKSNPDLIILDLVMPKMGGLQFLQALKAMGGKQNTPILISSQLSKMNDISEGVSEGMGVGVKGYIVKASENIDTIIRTIEKTIGTQ